MEFDFKPDQSYFGVLWESLETYEIEPTIDRDEAEDIVSKYPEAKSVVKWNIVPIRDIRKERE